MLPLGKRYDHATLVVEDQENGEKESIVVLGGRVHSTYYPGSEPEPTNFVALLNVGQNTKQWRYGPEMNEKRYKHAAVICNRSVYAIGGASGKYSWGIKTRGLNSIEYIRAVDLLETAFVSKQKSWTTLDVGMSTSRA